MPRAITLAGFAALFVAGALLAGVATAETTTTTTTESATTTETTTETTTAPATTVATTATVEQTTTRRVTVPSSPTTTAAASSSTNGTPAWVWALLAILAAALIGAGVLLALGGRRGRVSVEERRRRLDGAVGTWAMQGWTLESQAADSAVLRRGSELMLVSVDDVGNVSARTLPV